MSENSNKVTYHMSSPIKAKSPAAFAEQYIVESIWRGRFAVGSALPAERELSDLIGVTRTTLREVLQRLARDGWLTIQHGKPTRVNNIWQSSGLTILNTMTTLDVSQSVTWAKQLIEVRTLLSRQYIPVALKQHPDLFQSNLELAQGLEDSAEAYADFDWLWHHKATCLMAHHSVYTLILNSYLPFFSRVLLFLYEKKEMRQLSFQFYLQLIQMSQKETCEENMNQLDQFIVDYGLAVSQVWEANAEDFLESGP